MIEWFKNFAADIHETFIVSGYWKWLAEGLGNTLLITFVALLIGIVIGVVVAAVRSTYDNNKENMKRKGGAGYVAMSILNGICNVYLTIIRGTPVVVQLLIMFFIVFPRAYDGVPIAILTFGINSGAYVAEIFRGGILSIDKGQFEAGRSLGFNYMQTMVYVIIPQTIKNVLPTLCNEFIVLLKETSVVGYISVMDLTKAGEHIISNEYQLFVPLIAVALIYLALVMIFTWLLRKLERRLRRSDR